MRLTDTEFETAVGRYGDTVFRLAYSYLKNRADAEDVMQETLLKLYLERKSFQSPEHERHWVVRVAVNECKRLSKCFWRTRTVPLESAPEPSFSDEDRRAVYREVMALPGKYRVPLYLYYYEGYPVKDIAALLGLKASTVQTRLARGREQLKTILTEE